MIPEDVKLDQISTVLLGVQDVKRSLEFYRDKLGLQVRAQFEGFAFLDTGAVMLVLSEGLARATQKGPGATEVVFAVDGVREDYQGLKGKGVEFINEPRQISGPQWGASFRDPDGHFLSILGPERRAMAKAG